MFDYFYQINLIGMVSILLATERLSTIIDFIFNVLVHGLDYVKSQHLTINYYHKWIKSKERCKLTDINKAIHSFTYKPVYSILMAGFNSNGIWLDQAIESINRQFYPYWELYLYVNDASRAEIHDCLAKWRAAGDPRISII